MNKTLLHLFTALLLAVVALPGISQAASGGGDYVALQVPDLRQAVIFFHDVLNCNTLSGADPAELEDVELLNCGRETVVELNQAITPTGEGHAPVKRTSFTLSTDDATNVAAWLRANHIHLVGKPLRVESGADHGKIAVSFLTPWGQPLQLVSRIRADDLMLENSAPAAAVAAQ